MTRKGSDIDGSTFIEEAGDHGFAGGFGEYGCPADGGLEVAGSISNSR